MLNAVYIQIAPVGSVMLAIDDWFAGCWFAQFLQYKYMNALTSPLNKFVCIYFQVFKNLKRFLENKQPGDDLFDRLNVSVSLNCLYIYLFQYFYMVWEILATPDVLFEPFVKHCQLVHYILLWKARNYWKKLLTGALTNC